MTDERKTKRQLVAELKGMRRQVAELRGRLQLLEGDNTAERVRAESQGNAAREALRESEERFRSVFSQSPIAIELHDSEGHLIDANAACLDMFGVADLEMVKGFNLFEDPNMPEDARRRLLDGEAVSYESEFDFGLVKAMDLYETTKSGGRCLDCLITPWVTGEGTPSSFLVHVQDITERKRAEEALREAHEQLEATLNALPDLLFELDRHGRICDFRAPHPELLYVSPQEFIGRTMGEVLPTEAAQVIAEALAEAVERGRHSGAVYPLELPQGTHWFELSIAAKGEPEATSDRYVMLVRDITERVRTEEQLRESEERFSLFMAHLPGAVFIKDTDDRLVYANQRFAEIAGRGLEDLLGRRSEEYTPPDLVSQYAQENRLVVLEGQTLETESVFPGSAGPSYWTTYKFPIYRKGTPAFVGAVSLDVTERARAEEALEESHGRLLTILDSIDADIYVADMETYEILFMNQHMQASFGEDLIGRICWEVFRDESGPCTHCTNDQLLDADGNPAGVIAWEGQNPITGIWYLNYDRAIKWVDGRLVRLQVATDITEHKRVEESLLRASRLEATATLAGGIAHDFNNLMAGVLGYAEMLKMDLAGRENELDMLDAISESARRASRLAQQMLAFARGGKYRPRAMNLNEIIQRVAGAQEHTVPARIRIVLDSAPELWDIEADPAQMSEVVLNLLINAVEAVESDGRIAITTSNCTLDEGDIADLGPGQYVCLAMRDTGHGISQEVQARIFEPFFTTKFQGRGMGLAAVYGIVENHGGHIAVQSEEGQGATFEVYLPVIQAEAESTGCQGATETRSPVPAAGAATILIVQDDESLLKLTQRMVERLGYRSLVARSGQEAVESARASEGEIRLALIDVEVPEMDELEIHSLLATVRPETKVILYGSYELNVRVQALLDAGISAFVQKPFQMSVLEAEIRGALED